VIAGGETTVTIRGRGKGGRCQEFALTAALAMDGLNDVVTLAAGTDGSDGPTEAAGALVDPESVARARVRGFDPEAGLAENDSNTVLGGAGDLVVTGPTNTNLLDLYMVLVH
jgi:hydroxypyruvate reductase